jgi:hypothetical protein
VFTRKHVLATRAASLGLVGVILLVASVAASSFDSPATSPAADVAQSVLDTALAAPVAAQQAATATVRTVLPAAIATATAQPPQPQSTATTPPAPTETPVPLQGGPSFFDLALTMLAPFNTAELYSAATPVPPEAEPQPEPEPTPEVLDGIQIRTPYRTQFDGSYHEGGNCGIASIAMALEYYGVTIGTHELRESVNRISGDWGRASGVSWTNLRKGVEQFGLKTYGLTDERGRMKVWTMDDLLTETQQGRPVIILAHYRSLPGHETAGWYGDHYIVFLGMTGDGNVVYHDPAFRDGQGAVMVTSQATFERAWTRNWSGVNRSAMSIGH